MKSVTRYRGYEIVRIVGDKPTPWRIYRGGALASPVEFWNFGDARRAVDDLKSY